MKVAIIGTGYVGLVTGTCFAEMGVSVVCIDNDSAKIDRLRAGEVPIYEPGLEALIKSNVQGERLHFSTDIADAVATADIVFIAVGTPPGEDGAADLQHVIAVARGIGRHLRRYAVIVNKSTVPVGTADKVAAIIREELAARGETIEFDVVSNPEFLKEGSAISDFMSPDRVIIGTDSNRARDLMHDLYRPFMRTNDRVMFMGVRDSELTKYAANAMLATKISFINEIANIAERVGADIANVRLGMGADQRIGYHFIYPGCGYGGSCFPKDVRALVRVAQEQGIDPLVLNAVEARNARQKQVLFAKLGRIFDGDFTGRTVAVWGLAFKPGTDDVREAPSLHLIRALLDAGATVVAHDPVAAGSFRTEIGTAALQTGRLRFCEDHFQALDGADALVLVTEWKQYRQPDFDAMKTRLKAPVIIDGRNQYDGRRLRGQGWIYAGIGH